MSSDHYSRPAEVSEARIKIERSDFLATAFPVESEEEFFTTLHRIEKQHFDATHHCWAFRLFAGGDDRKRSSDAGEPSGTAGRPILSAIEGADLFDTGVVVVRWYGGVKLGTGGLSRAYRETAAAALSSLQREDRYVYERFVVVVPFEALSTAYRLVHPPDVLLIGEAFDEINEFTYDVRRSRADEFRKTLAEKRLTLR